MRRFRLPVVLVALIALVAGCASSAPKAVGPTTSMHYVINPVAPGHGFVQLGGAQYSFDGVICAHGPVASDPPNATRQFGVYANFTEAGTLYAISLTRYENDPSKGNPPLATGVPTITDLALVQSQGKGEVLGLQATRFMTVGKSGWSDPRDAAAHAPLIKRTGDVYEAAGVYGPDNQDQHSKANRQGTIKVRCPAKGTTTTVTGATTAPGAPGVPGATTVPRVTVAPGATTVPAPAAPGTTAVVAVPQPTAAPETLPAPDPGTEPPAK